MTQLRVAMVSWRSLPFMGGVETHIDEVSRRLAARGVDVTVLSTDTTGELPTDGTMSGYRVRRFPAYPRSRDYYFAPGMARYIAGSRDFDIIHVQGAHSLVPPMALAAARRAHVPSVLTFHTGGNSSGLRESLRPLQFKLVAPLFRSAAALVAVSEYERRRFAGILGVPEESIRLIRNGSDPLPVDADAAKPEGSPVIVSVGRFERYKGHHRILEAMPKILAQAPEARLYLVGKGPYEQDLRDMANALGVAEHVTLRGFGPEERGQMGSLVANADVMCLLSEYEAHPVAVMEAIGTGTKALVADTSGLSELGHAGLATIIPLESSPEQVAAAALAVAAEPKTAPPKLPTWDDCVDQLEALYSEIRS